MTSIRGWSARRRMGSDPVTENYQAVCGHYVPATDCWCQDCNLYPLTLALEVEQALHKLLADARPGDAAADVYAAVSRILDQMEAKRASFS